MYLQILLAITLGILAGTITGLIPGIHVNLIAVLIISLPLNFQPILIAIFILSVAITHSFLDSIPSIYLGAPDEAQALSVLPGHRLLHQGLGHQAITYTLLGSFGCLILSILLFPIFLKIIHFIYPYIKPITSLILIVVVIYMILKDKNKLLLSLIAFLLSGTLGLIVFTIPNLKQPLFPLLSGLFGISIIVTSLLQESSIPKQTPNQELKISKKNTIKAISAASSVGLIAAFLPGFGNSQAAIIATQFVKDIGDEGFLTLVGGINTANMVISIATAYALQKARNGAIVTIQSLLTAVTLEQLLIFLSTALIVGGIAVILGLFISKKFLKLIQKVNYRKLMLIIIVFITLLVIFFDTFIGIIILLTATGIGLLTSFWGVGKNHLMGCLILPVIIFLL
jgi:putative membrane protein